MRKIKLTNSVTRTDWLEMKFYFAETKPTFDKEYRIMYVPILFHFINLYLVILYLVYSFFHIFSQLTFGSGICTLYKRLYIYIYIYIYIYVEHKVENELIKIWSKKYYNFHFFKLSEKFAEKQSTFLVSIYNVSPERRCFSWYR